MLEEEHNDTDVTDSFPEEINRWIDKLMPYQRPIMIYGMIILILLVVFLGFAYGMAKMCNEFGGILDGALKCHQINYTTAEQPFGGEVFPLVFNGT